MGEAVEVLVIVKTDRLTSVYGSTHMLATYQPDNRFQDRELKLFEKNHVVFRVNVYINLTLMIILFMIVLVIYK